ncbi:MAG: hypothetical protein ACJAZ9_002012 [Neolewinella sp.]|jgi:hypothetical protein
MVASLLVDAAYGQLVDGQLRGLVVLPHVSDHN